MAIDLNAEALVEFGKAGKCYPGPRKPSRATMYRHALKGVRGIKLETVLIGGLRYTSREAVERFIAAQNEADNPAPAVTKLQRKTQAEAAQKALAAMGCQ